MNSGPAQFFCFMLLLLALLGCNQAENPGESARLYYFDAVLLGGGGQFYVYEPVNNSLHPEEIWHKRFSGDYNDSHIYSRLFSPDMTLLQETTESLSKKGAALIQMELYPPAPDSIIAIENSDSASASHLDTNHSIRVQINDPTTFLFGPPQEDFGAKYQIEYLEPGPDSVHVILTRFRKYAGSETYEFQGKSYPAMRYTVDETLETETEGFTTSTWTTTEIYAKGLGLVYYKKDVNEDFVLEYRLKEIVGYEQYVSREKK